MAVLKLRTPLLLALACELILLVLLESRDHLPLAVRSAWFAVALCAWMVVPIAFLVGSWYGIRFGWSRRTVAWLLWGMVALTVMAQVALGVGLWVDAEQSAWMHHAKYTPLHLMALLAGSGVAYLGLLVGSGQLTATTARSSPR